MGVCSTMISDKHGKVGTIESMKHVVLEFGCGPNKTRPEAIAVDCLDYPCVDVVGDAMEVLGSLPAGSVDEITSAHFLEHLPNLCAFLNESARVLKPGGWFRASVPHFSNPYYYSDLTHRVPFGMYTMSYLAHDSLFSRRVPAYEERLPFDILSVDLVFGSYSRRTIRHWVKKIPQLLFNSSIFMKEVYEENFCFLVPCYEIHYLMRRQ